MPTATYRLQIQPAFTFDDAAEQADYLAALGVSHAYLSPLLQPAPGSTHGYDVVDHSRLNEEAGGREAFDRMVRRLHEHSVRAVADVVPNHMTVPSPAYLNRQWWSLLREGRGSEFAHWFDVDWEAGDGRVLMPVLGSSLEEVLGAGELSVDDRGGESGNEWVVRYYDHQFPVRPGTETLPLAELLAAQAYRLAHWREGGDQLNYRRFFDVTTLAAVRVEDPEVFDATHALLLELVKAGELDGLRIDHPDGLADPRGYLDRLADATGDSWVVAEKILEGHEELPNDWRCAGTTGYDTLLRVGGVFVDSSSDGALTDLNREITGDHRELAEIIDDSKRLVVEKIQAAEVNRLLRLIARLAPDLPGASARRALEALLVAMDRYRAYIVPGERAPSQQVAVVDEACDRAESALADSDHAALSRIRELVLGIGPDPADEEASRELIVRFQQTCGPVMAKAIEDTAFYRYVRLTSLNEVGGNPGHLGTGTGELHDFAERQLASWPTAMTTLSTHDTKRSEDVRATIGVISELPHEWGLWLDDARRLARAAPPRAPRRGNGVPPVADGGRRLADRPRTAPGLRHQGDPRGQGAHDLDRPRRGLRGRRRPVRRRPDRRAADREAHRRLARADQALRACGHPRPEAAPPGDPGCARRLPGHRGGRPVPGRPRQPPARRLPGSPSPACGARRGHAAGRPR